MIKLRVDDETAIPLSVDSSSAVSMTVSEAFIDRGGAAIQNNKNAAPSTSQVVVTPDEGFDGMAKVTVAAMPQGTLDTIDINFDTSTGHFTASAGVATSGYIADTASVGGGFQLDTQAAATITPSTVQRQAVAAHKYTTGAVNVGPIPSEYIVPTGTKSISANGTGIDVKAYEKVDVAVPGIVPSGTLAIATNGSHDVTNYATASVAVPASAVDTGAKSITANGNGQDVVGYAAVNVNVPNSYAAADEGKVVSNGALVAQTSDTVTTNDTYDTTLINSLTVNVSGGGGEDLNKMIQGTLTTITNSDVTSIARGAFQYSALQSASFPNVETIGNSAFGSCASLSSVSFPKAKNISAGNVFDGTAIQILVLPAITSESGSYAFRNNAAMTHLDLGSEFRGFGVQACAGNTNMATIILRKSSGIVTLGQTAVFNNTPFKSGGTGGTIYIPKAMYDHLGDNSSYDYKAATNWTTVNGYGTITWAKIEGSIYETQYADGTPIT